MVNICLHPYLRYLVHRAVGNRPRQPVYLCYKTNSTAWHMQARVRHAQGHAHTKGIQTKHSGNSTAAFPCLGCYDFHRIRAVGFCLLHQRTHNWVVFVFQIPSLFVCLFVVIKPENPCFASHPGLVKTLGVYSLGPRISSSGPPKGTTPFRKTLVVNKA